MFWKHSHEGPGTGVRWAYLAVAVAIAIMGPGLMVLADTAEAPSGDAALETTLTASPVEEASPAEPPAEPPTEPPGPVG